MKGSKIVGTGSALPAKIVSNHDLSQKLDTSHDWILTRTGIHQRHIVSGDESALTLAVDAANKALEDTTKDDIDAVIVATMTPYKNMPCMASLLQKQLLLSPGLAFDINVACSGFVYAINIADMLIKSGSANKVLLVAVDVMSKILDWQDRSTCVLFGDGAGAVVIEASDENKLIGGIMRANGNFEASLQAGPLLTMQGKEVFKNAVKELEQIVPETLNKFNLEFSDIDWLVAHQANIRIIQATAKLLKLPMEKAIVTIDKHANTAAASIPLALDHAVRTNQIQRGECVLLEAFGAGFSWGSFVLRY